MNINNPHAQSQTKGYVNASQFSHAAARGLSGNELREETVKIKNELTILVSEKNTKQAKLAELNSLVRGRRLHPKDYERISWDQNKIKQEIIPIDRRISELKIQLRGLTETLEELTPGGMRELAASFTLRMDRIEKQISEVLTILKSSGKDIEK